jgi:hypothetical protein
MAGKSVEQKITLAESQRKKLLGDNIKNVIVRFQTVGIGPR